MTNITTLIGPIMEPASGAAPQSAVIFLHGYGADGENLISLSPYFAQLLPETVFLAPDAPTPCEMGGPGKQWFSLATYDPNMLRRDPEAHHEVWDAMWEGANGVAPVLNAFLDEVQDTYGLSSDRIALAGFSQGTMMALHVGLRRTDPLGGILGYSGALLGPERLAQDLTSPCPINLIHGSSDPVVPVEAFHLAKAGLEAAGLGFADLEIPGLQHGIEEKGADAGRIFLSKCFEDA